jgi:endonuclease-3
MAERLKDPFKVLVGTILSARTKDEVSYPASNRLFKYVKKPSDFKKLTLNKIEKLILPVNYYKTKAKCLKALSSLKKVPDNMEDLLKIKGVGRKTANIVLNVAFGKPAIAVDTHVHRISNRLGYVTTKTPKQTEIALINKLPKKYWGFYNYLLVVWGQNICTPLAPWCSKCKIKKYCKRINVEKSR